MILRIKSMWKMIKYNMISLLLFEAGYRVATFLIITNLTSTAVNYSLKKRNFSYLTAENFHKFLQNPTSLIFLFGILLLILFFFLIEISAVLSCFSHSYQKRKIYTSDMLIEGIRRTQSELLDYMYFDGSSVFVGLFFNYGNLLFWSASVQCDADL